MNHTFQIYSVCATVKGDTDTQAACVVSIRRLQENRLGGQIKKVKISYSFGPFLAITPLLQTGLTSKLLLLTTLLCYTDNLLLLVSKHYYYLEHRQPLIWLCGLQLQTEGDSSPYNRHTEV